jgi:hypothetical protein
MYIIRQPTSLRALQKADRYLQKQVPGTVFAVGLHEGHVSPIFDRILGERSQTKQETELRTWLAEILGQKVAAAQVAI